jgi:uncharacterized protein (DUF983 family)
MKNSCDCSSCKESQGFDKEYDPDDNAVNVWCSVFVIGAIVVFFLTLIFLTAVTIWK